MQGGDLSRQTDERFETTEVCLTQHLLPTQYTTQRFRSRFVHSTLDLTVGNKSKFEYSI
jgi:hypothetical protein